MNDAIVAELLNTVNSMRKDLSAHMADEEGEINSMKADIGTMREELTEWRIAAEQRHSTLIQSLQSWTTKMDCSDAFVHVDGKPDLHGHYDEHLSSKEFRAEVSDIKKHVRKIGITGAVIGFFVWSGYILWAAFLKGPQ